MAGFRGLRWAGVAGAVLGTIVVVVALLPTPGSAAPRGLSATDVAEGYGRSIAEQWEVTSERFPDVPQPAIDGVIVLGPDERDRALELCYARHGIVASISDDESTFAIPAGTADADFAVTEFVCRATYPTSSAYDLILSAEQRDALYDYYVGVLAPCMVTLGVEVSAPPPREAFVAYSGTGVLWSPVPLLSDASWSLQGWDRCSPTPAWMNRVRP